MGGYIHFFLKEAMQNYIGIYVSAETSMTGCVQSFATEAQPTTGFPPRVAWKCPLCEKDHNFKLQKSVLVSTPSAAKSMQRYFEQQKIMVGVPLKAMSKTR